MSNIQIFNHSIHDIGYISRTVTYGEEYEMVLDFIDCYLKSRKNLKNKQIAIFIEPQIDTGYPDIVIVDYYITKGLSWVNTRYKLTYNDLKILFEIQKNRSISINKLKISLGFSENELEKIIDEIIISNPNQVAQYKAGKDRLFDFFVGQVMKNTKGKANPIVTKELLHKKLD